MKRTTDTDTQSPATRRRSLWRRGRVWRAGLLVLIGLAALWLGGFLMFVKRLDGEVHLRNKADGIVVLTGGAERLNAGLGLLDDQWAERLLITGVHENTKIEDLMRTTIGSRALFECCVDLGRAALNTRGNAIETAEWAAAHGYTRLVIVTSNYHMPRSLTEFRCTMPETDLVPYPVRPPDVFVDKWWRWPGTTRLLASEYTKYLVALVTLGPWRRAVGLPSGCSA